MWKDIADKYIIPGETQTPAIMFVPSESIYADLHEFCPDVIREAQHAQVVVVSPNILMLAIVTVQTVLKDARMREQANLIQKEVGALLKDVRLLGDRTEKLGRHFDQATGDIKDILTSAGKIVARAEKIEKVELGRGRNCTAIDGRRIATGTARVHARTNWCYRSTRCAPGGAWFRSVCPFIGPGGSVIRA